MLIVFLSGRGAIVINWLSSRVSSTTTTSANMYLALSQILHSERNIHSPGPIVHFDNTTPLRSAVTESFFEGCRFRHAPQPPDSHDISPCDFFLFGDLKAKLRGEGFEMLEQLQERVEALLREITPELMERVYRHWIERLDQVIRTSGDYI
jgi:hypothetical protein